MTHSKGQSIGEHFRFVSEDALIEEISDKEFDTKFLKDYGHISELQQCCHHAISELANEPFLGRLTCAKIMARAMERLRAVHKTDVPGGWYPAIKRLRVKLSEASVGYREPSPVAPADEWPVVPPGEVLTSQFSAINGVDHQSAETLAKRPEIKNRFVALAERRGVPECWHEGLDFITELLSDWDTAPAEVIRLRDDLASRVQGLNQAGVTWDSVSRRVLLKN
jgi:hypothetical protein